ncbi:MAG: alpha/beta fold hydrolase [Pseudomonadota bacterium]
MIPLVLLHGFLGGSQQWDALATALGRDRQIVAVDLPGFGTNAHLAPLDRIESFASWVIGQLRQKGINRYHLLGHSMGGMIAQEISRLDAESLDRLILYGTGPVGNIPGRFETMEESRLRAQKDGAESTVNRISATWLLKREYCPNFPAVAALARLAQLPAILAGLEAMESWSGTAELSKIDAKTLIIWGEWDRSYNWAQINQLWNGLKDSSLCVLPGCAHLAHLEEQEIFNQVVKRFLL